MLESGEFMTVKELARREGIQLSYLARVLRLTLLAPDLIETILEGRQPEGFTLPALMKQFPVEWERQSRQGYATQLDTGSGCTSNPDGR